MNWLLTDEFAEFSKKISEIYENKKEKKAELKAFYDKTQSEIKALEEEAKEIEKQFQEWQQSQQETK